MLQGRYQCDDAHLFRERFSVFISELMGKYITLHLSPFINHHSSFMFTPYP